MDLRMGTTAFTKVLMLCSEVKVELVKLSCGIEILRFCAEESFS